MTKQSITRKCQLFLQLENVDESFDQFVFLNLCPKISFKSSPIQTGKVEIKWARERERGKLPNLCEKLKLGKKRPNKSSSNQDQDP